MIRIEHTPFNQADYLVKLAGLLVQKELVSFNDLSNYDSSLVSDIISACFDSSIKENIFDDILAAKPEDTTAIYAAIDSLIANRVITKRQVVELHKKFGVELGKYILRSDKEYYQILKEKLEQTRREQAEMKNFEAYQDAIRATAQRVIVDTDACLFLAYLVKQNQLDLDGLKLIDVLLGMKIKGIEINAQAAKTYIEHSNIDKNIGLRAVLVIACCDIGLDLDDISAIHRPLGSRVGAILLAKTDY